MKLICNEISMKSALSKSGIPGMKYCVNPYVGCAHACRYCYATFMKRFTGHLEPWGTFVDVKTNVSEILRRQLRRSERGTVMLSSVTDPYQPVEAKYQLTRKCLEALAQFQFPVNILTKSPLVTRDIDIISTMKDASVGLTITTENEDMRKLFEPGAPSIASRVEALKKLHKAGIRTYVFIGPLLPMNPEYLTEQIAPFAHSILIDRMNYENKTKALYIKNNIEQWLEHGHMEKIISRLLKGFDHTSVSVCGA